MCNQSFLPIFAIETLNFNGFYLLYKSFPEIKLVKSMFIKLSNLKINFNINYGYN